MTPTRRTLKRRLLASVLTSIYLSLLALVGAVMTFALRPFGQPLWTLGPDRLTWGPKRICTWVRLHDRLGGRTFRDYNTHLYLTEAPRREAVRLILEHLAAGDPAEPVVLTADFNATPRAPSRQLFAQAGLADSAEKAGQRPGAPTFQLYGIPVRCLDGVLVGPGWRVKRHLVLDAKPHNTFPSDHFGVLADLSWGQ